MFYSFLLFFFFISGILSNFSKKLMLLLMLESFYISFIFVGLMHGFFNIFSSNFLILMMVFLVLDSVFGICLLICCSRNSAGSSWMFYNM